jgi:hypothetical protein
MRTLILIAALSLLATQAHAGGSRSLSLTAANAAQPAEQPATSTADTPKQAPATPAATAAQTSTTTPPTSTTGIPTTTPVTTGPARSTVASKPRHREPSVEARVIRELHRHGIYW